jgi:hypothetical protein
MQMCSVSYVTVASNILILAACFHVCVATSQDMPGASSDQADALPSMTSSMNHHFITFTRSRSRSSMEIKFPSPQSQLQPDMVPDFDHQQPLSPQVSY